MSPALAIERIDSRQTDVRRALAGLRERLSPRGNVVSEAGRKRTIEVFGEPLSASQVVERICGDVQTLGLAAVLDYSARLDRAQLTAETLRVPAAELAAAHRAADGKFLETLARIKARILEFQRAILHRDVTLQRPDGSRLTQRYIPLDRVGICVPGGAAAYPSTVLMTAVPAQAAGVKELVVIAPPTKFGAFNPDLLATCHELGIEEVYRVGGAQGVAALAYGVEGIRSVDKIVGPGNLFVALAKKHVFGEVDIDSIAGPSEVVVIADDAAPAEFVAADLIAQAEHAPGASVLVTWSAELIERVADELRRQLATADRGAEARHSLEQFGALILVSDSAEAARVANELAPEHLHIACQDAERLAPLVRHAGAIFLGNYSPVAVGDYAAGPSHVLPTGGTARFASGLSANDFLRSNSVIHYSRQALEGVADDIRCLADKEGLAAHRASIDLRLSPGTAQEPKRR
ncbi:MAG TPA: histidinol dehydrogenase [Pirellulales bacterium]|nr:histidinol dehydrogenase [Pirellulales bacterium]